MILDRLPRTFRSPAPHAYEAVAQAVHRAAPRAIPFAELVPTPARPASS